MDLMFIQLYGPFGDCPSINTRNQAMVSDWLHEWLPALWPADMPADAGKPRAMVQPTWGHGGDELDWHCDSRIIGTPVELPRDPAAAVERLAWLRDHPEELMPDYAKEGGDDAASGRGPAAGPV
jgi:hypothetical protein